jgi:hypothetical protein
VTFLLKMGFVLLGAIFVGLLQSAVTANVRAGITTAAASSAAVKVFAVGSILAWLFAMITGRLIAYL